MRGRKARASKLFILQVHHSEQFRTIINNIITLKMLRKQEITFQFQPIGVSRVETSGALLFIQAVAQQRSIHMRAYNTIYAKKNPRRCMRAALSTNLSPSPSPSITIAVTVAHPPHHFPPTPAVPGVKLLLMRPRM